jgi:hypothetical protein
LRALRSNFAEIVFLVTLELFTVSLMVGLVEAVDRPPRDSSVALFAGDTHGTDTVDPTIVLG